MIVVYAFFPGDQDLALKNVQWWNELGGCKGHEVLMIPDMRCRLELRQEIQIHLGCAFDKVHIFPAKAEIDGWPEGANYFFRTATAWLQDKRQWPYFFWMEPDAIPLAKHWLDVIQAEYARCGKPFMGDRVQVEQIPLHMSGVGVYPNPMHAYAGEAYRAQDVAWDMAGKDQIVPNAHFTKLIEHAWKHPTFSNIEELKTQIRPEAVLFHSSKDGSLIDLLRGRETATHHAHNVETVGSTPTPATNLSAAPVLAEPRPSFTVKDQIETDGEARESTQRDKLDDCHSRGGAQTPSCDIFIRTYPKDYQWLMHCLHSIQKFGKGFRKVWVISPEALPYEFPIAMPFECQSVEWKVLNEESEDGYLSQQIHKLYADVITDYQADNILIIDSDTLFTQPVTPADFFDRDGKIIWYYTPYEHTETPWRPITEKFMGHHVEHEFMRRLPMMIPRWLFSKLREYCHNWHGRIISEYIRNQPLREFSEFNALGAYAWQYYHSKFHWVNTIGDGPMPGPLARQFFSWGGITEEVKKEIDQILRGAEDRPIHPMAATSPKPNPMVAVTSAPLQIPDGDDNLREPEVSQSKSERGSCCFPTAPPPALSSDPTLDLKIYIGRLARFANESPVSRQRVMKHLSLAGLTPRWPKKKKKK